MSDHKKLTSLRHSFNDRTYQSNNIPEFKTPWIPLRKIKKVKRNKLEINHHIYKKSVVTTTTRQKTIQTISSKSVNKRKVFTLTRIHSKELIRTPAADMMYKIAKRYRETNDELYRPTKRRRLDASTFNIEDDEPFQGAERPYAGTYFYDSPKKIDTVAAQIPDQNENLVSSTSYFMESIENRCSNIDFSSIKESIEVDCKTPEMKFKIESPTNVKFSFECIPKIEDKDQLDPIHSPDVKPLTVAVKTEIECENNNSDSSLDTPLQTFPGMLLWVQYRNWPYWPSIVSQSDATATQDSDTINVRFFAGKGSGAAVKTKNVLEFNGLDAFMAYREEMKTKLGKTEWNNLFHESKFSRKGWAKAVAEGTFVLSEACDVRLAFYEIVVVCSLHPAAKNCDISKLNSTEAKKLFEENSNIFEDVRIKVNEISSQMGDIFSPKLKRQTPARTSTKQSNTETPPPPRTSTPLSLSKRRMSVRLATIVQSQLSVSQTDSRTEDEAPSKAVEIAPVKPKKNPQKTQQEKRTEFDLAFKDYTTTARQQDILFKGLPCSNVCKLCLKVDEGNTKDLVKCSGACGDYVHEKCAHNVLNRVLCGECIDSPSQVCYACKKKSSEPVVQCSVKTCRRNYHSKCLDDWLQSKKSNKEITCPLHVCHTCVSDDPKNKRVGDCGMGKLTHCIKCPTTFHRDSACIPAGVKMLTKGQHICIRHRIEKRKPVSLDWCYICGEKGGFLLCCESCPLTPHLSCLHISVAAEHYVCDSCETGRHPLYGEIVWAKYSNYAWWPAIVVPPACIPDSINNKDHNDHDLCVRFFGTLDFGWVGRSFVYLYGEGDAQHSITGNKRLNNAIEQAEIFYKDLMANVKKTRAPQPLPYNKICTIQLVPPAKLVKKKDECQLCACSPDDTDPCGPTSDCQNRASCIECDASLCPCGDKCNNQSIGKRKYASFRLKHMGDKGFGLIAESLIGAGTTVIEYVGELVTEGEFQSRLSKKQTQNFYYMKYKSCYIDAELKGNMSRFMNHSCNPNCQPQVIIVKGVERIGLVALHDIEKGTELTFDYEFDDKSHKCYCGEDNCRGIIGGAAAKHLNI